MDKVVLLTDRPESGTLV